VTDMMHEAGAHPSDPLLPRHVLAERYEIERELGRGGMATVYLATDLRHQRPVAIKVLRAEIASALNAKRFLREIHITCSLVHPHILSLYDSGESEGRIFFAMPYIDGETLHRRITREGRLSIEEAVRLTREVADALSYAHEHGIIHRDIKPENILLSGGHAVVADFGISRATGDTLTSIGLVVGTPAYMSPEQASGQSALGPPSDIYSLACVLYTMLTGVPPFDGPTPQAVAAQQVTEPPPMVRSRRPDVPARLDDVLQRALAKDPVQRYASAREFATALTEACAGTTTAPVRVAWELTRRRQAALALTAVLAIAVLWWQVSRAAASRAMALDPELIAVAPFFVASDEAELQRWKYDLPLLVSPRLDDAEPLRALSPATNVTDRPDVTDRASAIELGRRTHAGHVVFGRVLRDRRNAVRVDAAVVNVARGEVVDQVQITSTEAEEDPGRVLAEVSDSLSHALLASFGATVPVAATRHAAFGCATSSWPAVAKYLHGEQFYRRTQWDSAITAYRAAIAVDSGCALAYRRIAIALSCKGFASDSAVLAHQLLAGVHNRGLPPRDSLLVLADSLTAGVHQLYGARDAPASAYWALVRRLLTTLEEASRKYPGDAEVWYALGEARHHWGWGPASTTPREILGAFDEAIRQDSGFALSYLHPIEVSLAEGGAPLARRYVDGYLKTHPRGTNAESVRLVAALLDTRTANSAATIRLLERDPLEALVAARNLIDRWRDSAESAVRLSKVIAARSRGDTLQLDRCDGGGRPDFALAQRLAYRGHLRAAYCALGDSVGRPGTGIVLIELALLDGAPADAIASVFDGWLRAGRGYSSYALPWWSRRSDTASVNGFLRRADSVLRVAPEGARREKAGYDSAAARAYLALMRADTADALRRFASLPRTQCSGCFDFDRLTEARLLATRGSLRAAYRIFSEWRGAAEVPSDILIAYERARVAERIGEREDAIAGYRAVVEAWARADAVLQPMVAESRRALLRLDACRERSGCGAS